MKTKIKSYPIFLYKSNSSIYEFPEVSLYNLAFYKFFRLSAMGLFLSYKSPPLATICKLF